MSFWEKCSQSLKFHHNISLPNRQAMFTASHIHTHQPNTKCLLTAANKYSCKKKNPVWIWPNLNIQLPIYRNREICYMNHESRLWETLQDKWPLISTNYHTYTQNDEKEYRLKRDLRPIKQLKYIVFGFWLKFFKNYEIIRSIKTFDDIKELFLIF